MQAPQPLGSSRARPRALAESLPENQPLSRPRQSGTANMLRAPTGPPLRPPPPPVLWARRKTVFAVQHVSFEVLW